MHYRTPIIASLALILVQAVDHAPLKCLHKLYLREDEHENFNWDEAGTYIGEVADLSSTGMAEMLLASENKYHFHKHYQMYVKGYCVPPQGLTAFSFDNFGTVHSFDMALQDSDSVPAEYLARLDPKSKVQKWLQLDVKCDEQIKYFRFRLLTADQTKPYRLEMDKTSHAPRYRPPHDPLQEGKTRRMTLFPARLDSYRYSSEVQIESPDYPENFICLAELVGNFPEPLIRFDDTDVRLMTPWGSNMSAKYWVRGSFDLPGFAKSGMVRRYWVRKGSKGVFHTRAFAVDRTQKSLKRRESSERVLGIISA